MNPQSLASRTALSALRRRVLKRRFAAVSFPNWVGMKLLQLAPGEARIALPVTGRLLQYQGILHGGVVASLADTTATFAALTSVPDGTDVVTIEFKINFLAPVARGRAIAEARVIQAGRRVTVAEAHVYGTPRKNPVAIGTFTMLNIPDAANQSARRKPRP